MCLWKRILPWPLASSGNAAGIAVTAGGDATDGYTGSAFGSGTAVPREENCWVWCTERCCLKALCQPKLQAQFADIISGSSVSILQVEGCDSQVQDAAFRKGTSVQFAA